VIPGSMGDAEYLVRGKGNISSVRSAAHGAGRRMSRRAARSTITSTERNRYLNERGVSLISGDLDEAPQAYKNIDEVMAAQADLVDIVARFEPRIVQMDGGSKKTSRSASGSRQSKRDKQRKKQRRKKRR
jgi:tRNA-splicing ligase RtcB